MAVLTEAIEAAGREAGAATAGGLVAIETATVVMTIARAVETSTAVVGARELALARLLMTATIAPRGTVHVATMKRDATAAEIAADAARPPKGAVNRPNSPRMNAIDVPSSYSSWRLA